MGFTKNTASTTNISDLPVQPTISAIALQALFDKFSADDVPFENSLIDEMESIANGNSGMDNIGMTPIDGVMTTPQQSLEYLKGRVDASQPTLNVFSILDYGAVGNGVTDDTLSIKNAVSALELNGGGVLIIPQTNDFYLVSDEILITSSNVEIRGLGFPTIKSNSLTKDVFKFDGTSLQLRYLTISNIFIDCSVTKTAGSGLHFISCFGVLTSNVRIENCYDNITLSIVDHFKLNDSLILNPVHDCIILSESTDHYYNNNLIDGALNAGIHISGDTGGIYINVNDMINSKYNLLVDEDLIVGTNRELFLNGTILDSATDTCMYLKKINTCLCSNVWVASAEKDGVLLEDVDNFKYDSGTIFNNKNNGLKVVDSFIGELSLDNVKFWNNSKDNPSTFNNLKIDSSTDQIILIINGCSFVGTEVLNDILLDTRNYILLFTNNYINNRMDDTNATYVYSNINGNIPTLDQNVISNDLQRLTKVLGSGASTGRLLFDGVGDDDWLADISVDTFRIGIDGLATMLQLKSAGDVKWSETAVAGKGIELRTPDGTKKYRVSIDNAGAVITTLT